MKITRRTRHAVLGALALITLGVVALNWRASWISHRLLRSWATTTVRDASGDVYRLEIGTIRVNVPLRRITVDSMLVTTNEIANAARPRPLASLGLVFHDCRISGIHLAKLIFSQGFVAGSLGCDAVTARFVVPASPVDTAAPREQQTTLLSLQQGIALPSFAPRLEVERIDFPKIALDFHIRRAVGSSRVQLEDFRWNMTGFDLDPSDSASALRPLFSRAIELSADNLIFNPDSNTTLKVSALFASLTDSTLEAYGFSFGPALGRAAYARAQPYRRKHTTTQVARTAATGVDVSGLLLGRGLRARTLTLDSLLLDITNDHALPVRPGARPRLRTPQQWVAGLNQPIWVDSVVLRNSRVVYRLRNSGREDFGLITFGRINALALGVNTVLAGAAARAPLRLAFSTMFQDRALLAGHFAVPLRAAQFDMTYRGTLGAMSASDMNQFVEATTPIRIVRGDVTGIEFGATVTNGLTLGTVTPIYNDFTFAVNQEGSTGLVGRKGFFGGVARTMASFAVNWQKIYGWNPGDPRNKPRVGKIRHQFQTNEALPDFIWYGLRDGLTSVVRK